MVTFLDRKTGYGNSSGNYVGFNADVTSITDYYPGGFPIAERTFTPSYRFGFNGQEKVNEIAGIGNHNTALFWEYDTRTARRWNIDLVMKPWESPYSVLGGNPILNIDPLGDDWFKNSDGQTTWHKATGKTGDKVSLKGMEGEWENIGTEFLEFNGKSVKYSWQSTNEDGDLVVNSQTFDAVSGKGQDPTGYWNLTRVFDYSDGRQGQKNAGPTPEGLYSINKRAFIPNKNESGFQQFSDLSLGKKAAAPFGFSNWPGGRASWGDYRWKLQFEKADRAIGAGRDNFYLHGGSLWGSRGCIDCGAGINDFTKSFMGRQLGNDKVFLKVEYAEGLKFKIQNTPTNQGLRLTR